MQQTQTQLIVEQTQQRLIGLLRGNLEKLVQTGYDGPIKLRWPNYRTFKENSTFMHENAATRYDYNFGSVNQVTGGYDRVPIHPSNVPFERYDLLTLAEVCEEVEQAVNSLYSRR